MTEELQKIKTEPDISSYTLPTISSSITAISLHSAGKCLSYSSFLFMFITEYPIDVLSYKLFLSEVLSKF